LIVLIKRSNLKEVAVKWRESKMRTTYFVLLLVFLQSACSHVQPKQKKALVTSATTPIKLMFIACDTHEQISGIVEKYKESGDTEAFKLIHALMATMNTKGEKTCSPMNSKVIVTEIYSEHMLKYNGTGEFKAVVAQFVMPGTKIKYYGLFFEDLSRKIKIHEKFNKAKKYI